MSNDFDIEISLEDTLELDTVIKKSSEANETVTDNDNEFNMSGIQTHTTILNPKSSGTHTITVNGQELKVKVTDPDNTLNTLIDNFENIIYDDKGNTLNDYYSEDLASATISTTNPTEGTYNLSMNTGSNANTIVSLEDDGLPNYPSAGDNFKYWATVDDNCRNQVYYGRQSYTGGRTDADGYMVKITNSGSIYLNKNGRKGTELDKDTISDFSTNTYYECEVQWGSNGTHDIYLYDTNNIQVGSLSASDSTYTSGGISFTADNGSGSGTNYWDNMRIL